MTCSPKMKGPRESSKYTLRETPKHKVLFCFQQLENLWQLLTAHLSEVNLRDLRGTSYTENLFIIFKSKYLICWFSKHLQAQVMCLGIRDSCELTRSYMQWFFISRAWYSVGLPTFLSSIIAYYSLYQELADFVSKGLDILDFVGHLVSVTTLYCGTGIAIDINKWRASMFQ